MQMDVLERADSREFYIGSDSFYLNLTSIIMNTSIKSMPLEQFTLDTKCTSY